MRGARRTAAEPIAGPLRVGKRVPAFSLPDQSGTARTLRSLLPCSTSGVLLLTFYPEIETPACSRQVCELWAARKELARLGVTVAGMSPDPVRVVSAFAQATGVGFPLLSDPRDQKNVAPVMTRLGAFGEKNLYGKVVIGVRRSSVLIDARGCVLHHWPVVRATGHAERFLRFMRERAVAAES